jgi:hypothetical protein
MARTSLDPKKLKDIAEKLRIIRDRTFVHIDKENVFDPQQLYRDAGLRVDQVAQLCFQLWEVMKDLHRTTHRTEFLYDNYKGEDIPILAKLRDKAESEKSFV